MNMSYISIIISGVASLGVFVALISAIFFLVLSGLQWVSNIRSQFYEDFLREKRRPLSKSCFDRDDTWNLMEENKNQQSFSSEYHLQDSALISNVLENGKNEKEENNENNSKIAPHTLLFRKIIEKKIEELIGGSLDKVRVERFSTDSEYLAIFCKYHSLLSQEIEKLELAFQSSILNENEMDSKVFNHQIIDLKKLLILIISDVTTLPTITETLLDEEITNSSKNDNFHDKTYEDILATAILNKVIGHFQNTTDADILSLYQSNCQTANSSEKYEESVSSGDSSSESSQLENLSFILEEHIEEMTNDYDLFDDDENVEDCEFQTNCNRPSFLESENVLESEDLCDDVVLKEAAEDQIIEKEIVNSSSSWEDNWLFQKKRLRSTPNVHHPVPVPMLVPKPSNNFRALVGGIDADDLSDMSDCSDSVFDSRLITVTDSDTNDLSDESDKIENEAILKLNDDRMIDISKGIEPPVSIDFQSENEYQYQSKEVENLGNTSTENQDVKGENYNCFQNFDSNTILPKKKLNTSRPESKEKEKKEHLQGEEDIKILNHSELVTKNQYSSVDSEKQENVKENEYFPSCTKESSNFSDSITSNFLDEKKIGEYHVLRNYYVNASKIPSGMISPKTLTRFSEEIEKVYTSSNTDSHLEENIKEYFPKIQIDDQNKMFANNFNKKKIFALPNVKEIAEQFMNHEFPVPTHAIINREIKVTDKSLTKPKSLDAIKYNGKQVHSLTARSISKEFREGLKSNSSQKSSVKTIGETNGRNIVCHERSPSPTPTVNLQSIKKFWEEIITANSNSTLQN